jgi:hypothetical protein
MPAARTCSILAASSILLLHSAGAVSAAGAGDERSPAEEVIDDIGLFKSVLDVEAF